MICEFQERYARDFALLNYEWIEKHYGIEDHDREVLDHPFESVIQPGGQIFFAIDGSRAVGTVAMIPFGERTFELAKMAVSPETRGRGIGDKLMEACVEFAHSAGVESIILESNTKQEAAINLYRKFGFREIPLDPNSQFARANIRMQLGL